MQHEAKIAYYAFDVIQFFVPYAARLMLRGRVAYGLRSTRNLYTRRQAFAIETLRHCLPSTITLYRSPGCAYALSGTLFSFLSRDLDG